MDSLHLGNESSALWRRILALTGSSIPNEGKLLQQWKSIGGWGGVTTLSNGTQNYAATRWKAGTKRVTSPSP
eukprot:1117758-Rhodomonas_salina.2